MKSLKFEVLNFLIVSIIFAMAAFGQSGKKDVQISPTPGVNPTPQAENKTSSNNERKEDFQFVLSGSLSGFIEELNKFGKLKYRVSKAFNYGGDANNSQRFAAVLKFDPEAAYQYDWLTSPNRRFIESRLNAKSRLGFYVTHILPITGCTESEADGDTTEFPVADSLVRLAKGDVFLLEKIVGNSERQREYKVFTGKIGLGKSPTAELQKALDNVPPGFHPLKVLFNKSGALDFSVSILLEKDLRNENTEKIEYKFFKDVNGFEKEINLNAQNGFQLIAGRRIGLTKFALLAKIPGDAKSYILLDADKYQKEFDKKIAPGNLYKGMFLGDTQCDEIETIGAKLVFAQTAGGSSKYEYKFFRLTEKNKLPADDTTVTGLKKLLAAGFSIRDIFYSDGAIVILEK
ncbi:MAG: hypothetical protein WA584_01920 [Pyrinomonadaceae bacterium]